LEELGVERGKENRDKLWLSNGQAVNPNYVVLARLAYPDAKLYSDKSDGSVIIGDPTKGEPLGVIMPYGPTTPRPDWANPPQGPLGTPAERDDPENFLARSMDAARDLTRSVYALPHYEGFNKVLMTWTGNRQIGIMRTARAVQKVLAEVPSKLAREGMANWMDAGGDQTALKKWEAAAKTPALKKGYEAALKLTPEQLATVQKAKKWFADMFEAGVKGGVIKEDSFLEDYITHVVAQPFVSGGPRSEYGGKIAAKFKYSQQRTFPNFHELEEAGYRARTKDVAEIMAVYGTHLTNAIETRRLARAILHEKNAAGEALGKLILGHYSAEEGAKANYINDPAMAVENGVHYKAVGHSAFRGWGWTGTSPETGKPIITQGEIGVHPDIHAQLENAIGRSEIRKWYDSPGNPLSNLAKKSLKALDVSQSTLKGTMLGGISTFHAVHEYKRAALSRVIINPVLTKAIDPNDARTQMMLRTGLMLVGDREAEQIFSEGLGSRSLIDRFPGIGRVSRAVSDYTFHQLIPALKWHTWNAVYERNLKTFGKAASPMDVAYLTSKQVNERFGHLNLADLNRDPTFQHMLGWAALAPDFLESNFRNYAREVIGAVGSKTGRDSIKTLAFTALMIWTAARLLNKLLDDDWHMEEPFGFIHNGRRYTMRNEAEDLWRLYSETGQFVTGRLNPLVATIDQLRTGRNWRGEKVTTGDTLKEFLTKWVPISGRWVPGAKELMEWSATGQNRTISLWQEFISSQGIQVARHSPLAPAYELARKYRQAHGEKEDTGTYPTSRYQQLHYAIEDGDLDKAKTEAEKLVAAEREQQKHLGREDALKKIAHGFYESINHPWTKNKDQDAEFIKSLSKEDKLKVMAAMQHRRLIWKNFAHLMHVPEEQH
jgi:hypothetical protein